MDPHRFSVDAELISALARLERVTDEIATCRQITRAAQHAARIARIKLDAMIAANLNAAQAADRLLSLSIARPTGRGGS